MTKTTKFRTRRRRRTKKRAIGEQVRERGNKGDNRKGDRKPKEGGGRRGK